MDSKFALIFGLLAFWGLLYLIQRYIEKWSPRLLQRIRQRNLLLRIGSFGWETELFNGYISTFALRWRKYVQMWFSAGAALGLACMVITVLFLMPGYLISRITSSGEQSSVQLQLILPGITIPMAYVPHIMISIFITLAFHELGHALAGASDNKAIDKIGIVIQVMIPAAYVRFREEHYDLPAWHQLKVYCAGAWHNFVLYALVVLLLVSSSFWLSPLFSPPTHGPLVQRINFHEGDSPIHVGDRIVGLSHCQINTQDDWARCLENLFLQNESTTPAVCAPSAWFSSEDSTRSLDCCEPGYNGAIPCWEDTLEKTKKLCKPARDVWASGVAYCHVNSEHQYKCSKQDHSCARPVLQQRFIDVGLKLMQIRVLRNADDLGSPLLLHVRQHPYELLHQVSFYQYEAKWKWMPDWMSGWADHMLLILTFLSNLNLITPIVSLLPIFAFDGEYALYALTLLLHPSLNDNTRERIIYGICAAVTAAFALIFLASFYATLFS